MAEGLGLWLRRARESRKLSLEEVEKTLRIRRRYLQALEMGDYAALPGEIQARGFLRNYARFLNLSIEETLARYDSEMQGRPVQPRIRAVPAEMKAPPIDRPTKFQPPDADEDEQLSFLATVPQQVIMGLLGTMGLAFLVLLVSGGILLSTEYLPKVTQSTPQQNTPVTMVAAAMPTAAIAGPEFRPATDGTVTVRVNAEEHAWIRLTADAYVVFEGVATPGQTLETPAAAEQVTLMTGNGGAFHLYVNGEDWGLLGSQGQAVRRAWGPTGEESVEAP